MRADDDGRTAGDVSDAKVLRTLIDEVWREILGLKDLPANATFFEMGGTSLQLIEAHRKLVGRLGRPFAITVMFERPRVRDLAEHLATEPVAPVTSPAPVRTTEGDIAIVGLAARLPGVRDLDDFWQHVRNGDNLIDRFTPDEIEDSFPDRVRAAPNYVPARPWLEDVDKFDAKFFGFHPREAEAMDPQGRVFLELCYHALEDAGCDPYTHGGAVGVYAGQTMNTYMVNNVLGDRARVEAFTSNYQVGQYAEFTGNAADSLATRVAFKLNLTGPALTVQTACSTSLVAIAQACQGLRAGDCDVALAGGVSISFPQKRGYLAMEGGMVSEDGTCRPFDEGANGTVFGSGAGVVVLKRLDAALAQGDRIYAVIRGVGLNNDGAGKVSYTAPSVTGQSDAIRAAHRDAGIAAESISYVECHGTATPLGDPVEIQGLATAFGEAGPAGACALGSVKGNIGHLDTAAGVVGVIKTALMLHYREIPPVANFKALNPRIALDGTPFRVPDRLAPWPSGGGPRRAGVSSFGVGGTNAHLVMEEAPDLPARPAARPGPHVLPLSARSPEVLSRMQDRLADALDTGAIDPADAAVTLQDGRAVFEYRSAVVCDTADEAAAALRKLAPARKPVPADAPRAAFMFPGQGSQYPGMGSGLYATEPEFARWIDAGTEILTPILGRDINALLCKGDTGDKAAARALRETSLTQPALYLIQVATARLWQARGVMPAALIGHSVGEYAAATLAGVMDFETGLRLIAARGRLMQEQPGGTMLSVRAPLDAIEGLLDASVSIAARNAPKLNVLSGTEDAIAAMEEKLKAADIACTRLHTSHAFHSAMMDPVAAALEAEFAGLTLNAPEIPYVSCVTGTWITADEAQSPAYWARQARATVNFADALGVLAEGEPMVLLEVGAGATLSSFAGQVLARDAHAGIVQSLPDHTRPERDETALAGGMAKLWTCGVPVTWAHQTRAPGWTVSLPPYPFERTRYWIDAPVPLRDGARAPGPAAVQAADAPRTVAAMTADRRDRLAAALAEMLAALSGEPITPAEADETFLDLGFDSLFLGQVSQRLAQDYGVDIRFRQLLTDYRTINVLAAHLDQVLPADVLADSPGEAEVPQTGDVAPQSTTAPEAGTMTVERIVELQLRTMEQVFARQLDALGAAKEVAAPQPVQAVPVAATRATEPPQPRREAEAVHPDATDAGIGPEETEAPEDEADIAVAVAEPAAAAPFAAAADRPVQQSGVPLTEAQREIWMGAQMGDAASCSFNIGATLRFEGPLDTQVLGKALDAVVARHDGLRLKFSRKGDSFDVLAPFPLNMDLRDLSGADAPLDAMREQMKTESATPFDLVNGPLVRAVLYRLAPEDHTLSITAHHLVCDGWSFNVIYGDLARIYAALAQGQAPDLPPAPSYAAMARARRDRAEDPDIAAYWKGVFQTVPHLPDLPTDRPLPPHRTFAGASVSAVVPSDVLNAARAAGARQGCTLFSTLFGAFHILLARLANADDLVIGVPTAGQELLPDQGLVGHCVNFLPIRAPFDPAMPAHQTLETVRDAVLGAFEHKDYTYGALIRALDLKRSLDRQPLTEVLINLERAPQGLEIEGLTITAAPGPKAAVNFDLFFNMVEGADGLHVHVDYNTDLFDESTIRRWLGHLTQVMAGLGASGDLPAGQLPLLSPEETDALVSGMNRTGAEYPAIPIHAVISQAAARTPDKVAVTATDRSLTYAELEAESDALAAAIQAQVPTPGGRVAVALDRSAELIVALLAVLKAGHAYVPLDPRQPAPRLRSVLEEAQVAAVVCAGPGLPEFAEGLSVVPINPGDAAPGARPAAVDTGPDASAYVIFTSGSTGKPKGVEIPHGAVVNFLTSMAREPGFGPDDTILAITTVSFDIAVLELFLPLVTGGRTVILTSYEAFDGFRLAEIMRGGDVTVMQATPTAWRMMLEAGLEPRAGLKLLAGGEPLPADLAAKLTAGGAELWNMYGPTETTIWSSVGRIAPGETRISIGHPIANTELHVLGPGDVLQPIGAVGELNIGGDGLAKGYFDRPDLTEKAFRDVTLAGTPRRLYRTGDLARRIAAGGIELLGRSDNQIKLRGFRIELGDIETALRGLPGIAAAAVGAHTPASGEKQLVGYVVPEPGHKPDPADLITTLRGRLPDYMVPTSWVVLSALPQTANGKLDRKALPAPEDVAQVTPLRGITPPSTELERQIAGVWQEVLGLESIGVTDTLYALGADSLKIFRIAARLIDAGLGLEARHMVEHPTIRELADFQAQRGGAAPVPRGPSLRDFRHGARRGGGAVR